MLLVAFLQQLPVNSFFFDDGWDINEYLQRFQLDNSHALTHSWQCSSKGCGETVIFMKKNEIFLLFIRVQSIAKTLSQAVSRMRERT